MNSRRKPFHIAEDLTVIILHKNKRIGPDEVNKRFVRYSISQHCRTDLNCEAASLC